MKLYFGRDEKDVITIEPGGMSDRTVTSDVAMRPRLLRCTIGGWPVTNVSPVAQHLTVASLRIEDEEQLMQPIPLAVLVEAHGLALPHILPDAPVYIKVVSTMTKDRVECVLWLEGEEIDLVQSRSVIVGDGIGTCGTRSPAEHAAHLEHELHRAHSQRDVAIEALKRIAGPRPDGAFPARTQAARSQEIAKEALKKIHALRRPNAPKTGSKKSEPRD